MVLRVTVRVAGRHWDILVHSARSRRTRAVVWGDTIGVDLHGGHCLARVRVDREHRKRAANGVGKEENVRKRASRGLSLCLGHTRCHRRGRRRLWGRDLRQPRRDLPRREFETHLFAPFGAGERARGRGGGRIGRSRLGGRGSRRSRRRRRTPRGRGRIERTGALRGKVDESLVRDAHPGGHLIRDAARVNGLLRIQSSQCCVCTSCSSSMSLAMMAHVKSSAKLKSRAISGGAKIRHTARRAAG